MNIEVPNYDKKSFKFMWESGYFIKCHFYDNEIIIEANKEGLVSLARHLLELSQDAVPQFTHFHLDEFGALEKGSSELIVVKHNFDD